MKTITVLAVIALGCQAAVDWPSFRGPNGSGVANSIGVPVNFGPNSNVIWKTPFPAGTSSPILSQDRIFLTGAEGDNLLTICLERATGKILWRKAIRPDRSEPRHKLNSPASSTPVTDGENLYVFFGEFGLVSYDRNGNERWCKPLGPFTNLHGMAASPILAGDKLIQVCDHDNDAFLLALHKDTGKVLWKAERPEVVHGFATPSVFGDQIIVPGSYQLTAYAVETGRKLWWVRGLTWQVKSSAIVFGDTIYATGWAPGADEGQRQLLPPFDEVVKEADKNADQKISSEELPPKWRHSGSWNFIDLERDGLLDARDWSFYRARRSAQNITLAVRPGNARGDLTDTHVLWRYDRSIPQVSSPLLYKGVFYTVKDGGIFTALDSATGSVHKQGRLPGAIDSYYSSPVAADNKIYVASETGKVSVIQPGPQWESLAVNDMEEPCYASPAIAEGRIYLRTAGWLYCFGTSRSHADLR